jgi:branched-chain amino acid transport system substrate-binding protein
MHGNTEAVRRHFLQEVEHLQKLKHPYIIRLETYGIEQGYAYLIMPYISDGSLAELVRKGRQFTCEEVLEYLQQAAQALSYAHANHITHRDVKPDNLLLGSNGILLSDFGIARHEDATQTMAKGTPPFCPPEQAAGHPVPASDQYALAVTACWLLTGMFPGGGGQELLHRKYPDIALVLERALQENPQRRYPSMTYFANALGHVALTGKPGLPRLLPPRPPVEPRPRHQPRWLVLAVLSIVFIVVLASTITWALFVPGGRGAPTLISMPPSTTIKIASVLPMSGSEKTTGLPLQNGVQMAIDEANHTSVLPGYTLELTSYDDVGKGNRSDPDMGVKYLHQAMADNLVAGVVGPYYSRVAQEELPMANQAPIALISPSTIYACLTKTISDDPNCLGSDDLEAKMRPTDQLTYFRLATTDDQEGRAVADYFFKVQHHKKVILIQDDRDPYIAMLAKTFRQEWEATLHGQVIPLAIPENGSTVQIYQQALQSVTSVHPDLVYFIGSSANGTDALRALSTIPELKTVAFAGDGNIVNADFLQEAGSIHPSAPVYATLPIQDPAHSEVDQGTSFEDRYASNGYTDYRPYAASAYAATMILIQAIKTALQTKGVSTPHGVQDEVGAKTFRKEVLRALAHLTYMGITGKQSFDANGDTTNHTISFYQLDLSKLQTTWTWLQQVQA